MKQNFRQEEKFILKGENNFHLAPFKYEWAYSLFKNDLANRWHPQEVGMGKDKECYEQSLTEKEKFLFKHVFATLTTADLAIGTNAAEKIMPIVRAAELKLYLSSQIAIEGLHSFSYQYIIESMCLDPDEIYSLYQEVEEINQFFEFAKTKVCFDTDSDLIDSLLFWYLFFEGVFFMTGFAAIYSLQRRNLMTGTATQLTFIQRDETIHVSFGLKLIKEIMLELGSRRPQAEVHELFLLCMEKLEIWAKYCVPQVIGYNAELHIAHSKYLVDRRLRALGYEPIWNSECVLPWLDEMTGGIRKETAFFEKTVIDYRSSSTLDNTW